MSTSSGWPQSRVSAELMAPAATWSAAVSEAERRSGWKPTSDGIFSKEAAQRGLPQLRVSALSYIVFTKEYKYTLLEYFVDTALTESTALHFLVDDRRSNLELSCEEVESSGFRMQI